MNIIITDFFSIFKYNCICMTMKFCNYNHATPYKENVSIWMSSSHIFLMSCDWLTGSKIYSLRWKIWCHRAGQSLEQVQGVLMHPSISNNGCKAPVLRKISNSKAISFHQGNFFKSEGGHKLYILTQPGRNLCTCPVRTLTKAL